jgi:hypothetical protein
MIKTEQVSQKPKLSKLTIIMAGWGAVLLLGGVVNQYASLDIDTTFLLWGGLTILGVGAQLAGMVKGLGPNLTAWLGVMVLGWAFTFYVFKFDNGSHIDMFGDLAGVWLILLGIGYIATAFQVDKRFFAFAGLHIGVGVLLELSARQVITLEVLNSNAALIFGLVAGIPLMIAAAVSSRW